MVLENIAIKLIPESHQNKILWKLLQPGIHVKTELMMESNKLGIQ